VSHIDTPGARWSSEVFKTSFEYGRSVNIQNSDRNTGCGNKTHYEPFNRFI